MVASNNDWVIPAGMHERRFVVQKVSDSKLQDNLWFGPLYRQLANGGYGAMLYDLVQFDLGNWHPREIVRTAALAEQQVQSLSVLDEWWLEILHTGVLVGSRIGEPHQAVSNEYDEEIEDKDGYGVTRIRIRRRKGLFDAARASSPLAARHQRPQLGTLSDRQGRAACLGPATARMGIPAAGGLPRQMGRIAIKGSPIGKLRQKNEAPVTLTQKRTETKTRKKSEKKQGCHARLD